jgi:hypothetical protein
VLPPLVIGDEEVAEGIRRLEAACARFERAATAVAREAAG